MLCWLLASILLLYREACFEIENELQNEGFITGSPLYGHEILTNVAPLTREFIDLRRILTQRYDPDEPESPNATMSFPLNSALLVDTATDGFKYQRIESEEVFMHLGKTWGCQSMSVDECRRREDWKKYGNDQSNRLALSTVMRARYDGRFYAVSLMNNSVDSVSEVR